MELATSEGEMLETMEVLATDWYEQPREKRFRVMKKKTTQWRISRRFTQEQNAQLDKLEIIKEEEETTAVLEQPSFRLGLKKKRIMRSNSSQANQQ